MAEQADYQVCNVTLYCPSAQVHLVLREGVPL